MFFRRSKPKRIAFSPWDLVQHSSKSAVVPEDIVIINLTEYLYTIDLLYQIKVKHAAVEWLEQKGATKIPPIRSKHRTGRLSKRSTEAETMYLLDEGISNAINDAGKQ